MILIILDYRILYFNPGRSLEAPKLDQYFHFIDHHPGVTRGHINRFADFSGVERVDVDASSMQSIAAIRSVTAAKPRSSKAAFFSSRPLGFDTAKMFETFFQSKIIHLRAMDNLDKALVWLGATDLKKSIRDLWRYP